MYIRQMFAQKPCVFSIECFPPKQVENYEKMKKTLLRMGQLHPDFINVRTVYTSKIWAQLTKIFLQNQAQEDSESTYFHLSLK